MKIPEYLGVSGDFASLMAYTDELIVLLQQGWAEAERLEKLLESRDASIKQTGDLLIQTTWERDEARAEVDLWFKRSQEHATEAERSRAQVKELAEALEECAASHDPITREAARAALSRLASADQRTGDTSSQ